MKKHTPATIALALGLAGATTLMAQAPTHDIDGMTDAAVQVEVVNEGGHAAPQWSDAVLAASRSVGDTAPVLIAKATRSVTR